VQRSMKHLVLAITLSGALLPPSLSAAQEPNSGQSSSPQEQALSAQELESQRRFEELNARLRQLSGKPDTAAEVPVEQEQQPAAGSLPSRLAPLVLAGVALAALVGGYAVLRRRRKPQRQSRPPAHELSPPPEVPPPAPVAVAMSPSTEPLRVQPAAPRSESAAGDTDAVVEQAQMLAVMGKLGNAIRLLTEHIDTHPGVSAKAWLLLLELYRVLGNRHAFDSAARRMHECFNIMVPSWDAARTASLVPTSLEEYPHVMSRIIDGWGTGGCRDYLQSLIQDNRAGERTGFGTEVFEELVLLVGLLDHMERR